VARSRTVEPRHASGPLAALGVEKWRSEGRASAGATAACPRRDARRHHRRTQRVAVRGAQASGGLHHVAVDGRRLRPRAACLRGGSDARQQR
jgi:hypothetical protein